MVQANKLAALVLIVPGHTTYVGLKSHVSDTEFGACEETMYEKNSRDVQKRVIFHSYVSLPGGIPPKSDPNPVCFVHSEYEM